MSAAYDVELWHDLFVAAAGAAAALTGLIFVAVSLNLDRILANPMLPSRAAESLTVLLALLIESLVLLAPSETRRVIGVEAVALGAVLIARLVMTSGLRHRAPDTPLRWILLPLVISLGSCLPLVIGGISMLAGHGGGLYWLLVGMVIGFAGAVYNAWILLIEILR